MCKVGILYLLIDLLPKDKKLREGSRYVNWINWINGLRPNNRP